jgi:hypothetical protein
MESRNSVTVCLAASSSPAIREHGALGVTRGTLQAAEVADVDVVEGLHDARLREVCLEQLAGRRGLVVEFGDVPVALGVVVVGVDDDLAA